MAVRIQVPKKAALVRFVLHPWGKALLITFLVVNTVALAAFTYYYVHYSRIIQQKLAAGPFAKHRRHGMLDQDVIYPRNY